MAMWLENKQSIELKPKQHLTVDNEQASFVVDN